jgi:Domain of unknown function (DUF4365)
VCQELRAFALLSHSGCSVTFFNIEPPFTRFYEIIDTVEILLPSYLSSLDLPMATPVPNSDTYTTVQQESFSYAFIGAIITAAGYTFKLASREEDNTGIDLTIAAPSLTGKVLSFPKLDAQVKCTTSTAIIKETQLHYPLLIQNYDSLRVSNPLLPRLLIVVLIPKPRSDWLKSTEEQTILQKSAYWISLKGKPKIAKAKPTIYIPRANLLTPDSLQEIMKRIADSEDL